MPSNLRDVTAHTSTALAIRILGFMTDQEELGKGPGLMVSRFFVCYNRYGGTGST